MPPRVTPTSVAVHGVGETCVEMNGPQVEEERMCGPEGGSHPPLCQFHQTVNMMCKKNLPERRRLKEKWENGSSCNSSFIIRLVFPRAGPTATVLPRTGDRLT